MTRGELYRVSRPSPADPRRSRVFLVVSRQELLDSRYSTVMCVPAYSRPSGVPTEVPIGPEQGLKTLSVLRCDEVTSVQRAQLRRYVGSLPPSRMREVSRALAIALDLEDEISL